MGDLSPGSLFADHRIEGVAGRGGMGVVYRARQLSLDRTVALKVIAPALIEDPAIRRRFLRESRIAASIDHPNVIPIYYTGEEDGVAFIAMRYVPGDDLRTLVRREGALPPARATAIVSQVAAALDAAHGSGLVHRDVKPANVLLGRDDHAYLTDFGLTKHALSEAGATRSGHWVGTLDFIAPEQIRSERVDARADVYGLGCVLHYALTGSPPFPAETDEAKLWAHLSEPPPRASDSARGSPAGLDAVIARALAKAPDARYQSAGDLGRAAAAAAAGEAVDVGERLVAVGAAAPVEVDTRTAASPAPPGPASREDPPSDTKRSRRAMVRGIATTLVVLALGAVVGYVVRSDGDGATSAPTATPDAATPSATASAMQVLPIRIGGRLNALAVSHDRVWTGDFRGPRLQAVEASTSRRLTDLRPEVGEGIEGLAVSGRTLWAIASRDHRLARLDARTGEPIGRPFALPPTSSANAVVAGRDSVWVATTTPEDDPGDQILNVDPATGNIRETIEVGDGVRRMALARGGLWVLRSQPAILTRIDLRTRERRGFRFEGEASGDLAVGAGALWVTLSDTNQVVRVKLGPRTRNPQPIGVGQHPVGVVVHDGSVWVANRDSSTLSRVDAREMRVRGEVEVPLNPYEVGTDGEALWVTSLALGRLTRVGPR